MMDRRWTLFTNHGAVFFYILEHPDATIRNMADALDLAERTIVGVLRDLRDAGYLLVDKAGRQNVYRVNPHAQLRRPQHADHTLYSFFARALEEMSAGEGTRPAGSGARR